jgi:hypothetical protein
VEKKSLACFHPDTWRLNYIHYTNYWLGLIYLVRICLKFNQETRCPDQKVWVCCSLYCLYCHNCYNLKKLHKQSFCNAGCLKSFNVVL